MTYRLQFWGSHQLLHIFLKKIYWLSGFFHEMTKYITKHKYLKSNLYHWTIQNPSPIKQCNTDPPLHFK